MREHREHVDSVFNPSMTQEERLKSARLAFTHSDTALVDEEDLLTPQEVATWLRVDVTTVRRWIKKGLLTAIRLPHQGKRQEYRIQRSTIKKIIPKTG